MIDVEAFRKFEVEGWEKKADPYHRFWGAITSRVIEPLLDAAGVASGTRTLDVATGPGYVAAQAADRGASVVGVDVAQQMLALAKKLHPAIEFRHADAERLPFPDGSFDAVVSNFIVPHLARPEQAVAELARVLAPGGRLALTTWDVPKISRILGVVIEAIEEVGAPPPPDLPEGPPMYWFGVDEEFAKLLRSAGLAEARVETVAFTHRFSSPDELWQGVVTGGVRTPAYLQGQTPEVRAQIRAAFNRLVKQYVKDGGLEIPVSVKLASSTKPR